jgi:APA family basic amino acid/polyamine antiporter
LISAALFYLLAVSAVFVLRARSPGLHRPYRTWGYPVTPALYILGAALVLVILFAYRPATTWPGLIIVLVGGVVYACLPRR